MKKLLILTLVGAALVAFVGVDVVKGSLGRARDDIRASLTANVPLETQLAEAQALVDSYAESVIKGEVASENLAEMIQGVKREVRVLEGRVGRQRLALVSLKRNLEVVPTSTAPRPEDREAVQRARVFKAQSALLARRRADLDRLQKEYAATQGSLAEARSEQQRLAEEVHVLAAEIESLEARTAAARTRKAVGDATISSSGFAEAQEHLKKIRSTVKERNKLLTYYEYERRPVHANSEGIAVTADDDGLAEDPRAAIEDALASFPDETK